jgi:hypothetical protein
MYEIPQQLLRGQMFEGVVVELLLMIWSGVRRQEGQRLIGVGLLEGLVQKKV